MIRNDREYRVATKRVLEEARRLKAYEHELERSGLKASAVRRAMDPLRSFHLQLVEAVDHYERLKRGDPGALHNLHGMGRFLIGLRIATGVSQRELASRLDVDESQVSRDERNEYRGASVERVAKVLDALGVRLVSELRPSTRHTKGSRRPAS